MLLSFDTCPRGARARARPRASFSPFPSLSPSPSLCFDTCPRKTHTHVRAHTHTQSIHPAKAGAGFGAPGAAPRPADPHPPNTVPAIYISPFRVSATRQEQAAIRADCRVAGNSTRAISPSEQSGHPPFAPLAGPARAPFRVALFGSPPSESPSGYMAYPPRPTPPEPLSESRRRRGGAPRRASAVRSCKARARDARPPPPPHPAPLADFAHPCPPNTRRRPIPAPHALVSHLAPLVDLARHGQRASSSLSLPLPLPLPLPLSALRERGAPRQWRTWRHSLTLPATS